MDLLRPAVAAIIGGLLSGPATAALIATDTNLLTIHESIHAVDADTWNYTYSFLNKATSPIWHILFYTKFEIDWREMHATGFPEMSAGKEVSRLYAPYDARNLDSSVTYAWAAFYVPFGTEGLAPGATASLSVRADVLDMSPKLYAVETIASGHAGWKTGPAGSQGYVASVGYTTVPEAPVTALLLPIAALAWRGIRSVSRKRTRHLG